MEDRPHQSSTAANEVGALADVAFSMADRVVTRTVQDVHRAIAHRAFSGVGPSGAAARVAHDEIANGVYGAIRVAGAGAAALAGRAARSWSEHKEVRSLFGSPRAGIALAGLNGLLGDELEQRESELRIELALRHGGRDLRVDPASLAAAYPNATTRVVLFVHGLVETDDAWRYREREVGATYGSRLQAGFGFTPLYLRYNTGLHISENGRRLSELLEELIAAWPVPLDELVLIGHSMGGLVARSACHHARTHALRWPHALRHLICLGSPHGGSPLEKSVNVAASLLGLAPESRPFANVLNTRSVGIKDLRFGYVSEDDWRDREPDAFLQNTATDVPLDEAVAHHFVAATVSAEAAHPVGRALGDLLVRVSSASGRRLAPKRERARHLGRLNHFDLLNNERVYEQISSWLRGDPHAPDSHSIARKRGS